MSCVFSMSSRYLQRRRQTNVLDRKLAAQITKQMANVIPSLLAQIQSLTTNNNSTSSSTANYGCTFKTFTSANPPQFDGTGNATVLLQWFENMESVFLHCECPDRKKTNFASSVFHLGALTWWNSIKDTRGAEVAMAMPWTELKELMSKVFCPKHELQKLEDEFWKLKQVSGDNSAYTTRFHELSRLVPHLVTPLDRAISST